MVQVNLPVPLSFIVQGKFACTTIIYGAGKFPSPLSALNGKTSESEIHLYHYHLWSWANLHPLLLFMVQGKFSCSTIIYTAG